jgi:hypothetical protein
MNSVLSLQVIHDRITGWLLGGVQSCEQKQEYKEAAKWSHA